MNNFDYPVPKDPVIPREPEMSEELESYRDDANGVYLHPKLVRETTRSTITRSMRKTY